MAFTQLLLHVNVTNFTLIVLLVLVRLYNIGLGASKIN